MSVTLASWSTMTASPMSDKMEAEDFLTAGERVHLHHRHRSISTSYILAMQRTTVVSVHTVP